MLELKNIVKTYAAGSSSVTALKGIDICFRENEFVAILGPSGCGKTTLLNLIGGLDQYTSGDLVINGTSTKQYTDHDWDTYRNHSIGFVFQSYNLIPHQSVLSNVELALTLSGVPKAERRQRAADALKKVGLGDQLHKKPNQMSGGQMQRVAIARALVNNPDILLADEPTGALDSETSVQIMNILKEIAADKLVIMVTHNPELAENYATRTIRLLDGQITSDSMPFVPEQQDDAAKHAEKPSRKTSMSFFTALALSRNNLMTKKTRTLLTAFAGSIGIIGIALILSLSNGIQAYIDRVQEDTLSSYPIMVESETVDISELMTSLMGENTGAAGEKHERDAIYPNTIMTDLINSVNSMETSTNNLKALKQYICSDESNLDEYLSAVKYSYNLDMDIYTEDVNGDIIKSDLMTIMETVWQDMYGMDASTFASSPMYASLSNMNIWEQMLPGSEGELVSDLMEEQYDLIYGSWPENYDEVVLIVDENNELSDSVLYTLGLKSLDELKEQMEASMNMETIEPDTDSWTYEEICNMRFKLILPCEYYQYDSANGTYTNMSLTEAGIDYLYHSDDVGTELKISGIIRVKDDAIATMMTGSIGYTSALTDYVIQLTGNTAVIQDQMAHPDTDVITGLPFATEEDTTPTDEEKKAAILDYLQTLSTSEKAAIYSEIMSQPTQEYVDAAVAQAIGGMTREEIEARLVESYASQMDVDASTVTDYIAQMDDETMFSYIEEMIASSVREQYKQATQTQLSSVTAETQAMLLDAGDFTLEQYVQMYDQFMPPTVSDSTYEENLELLGYVDKDDPSAIHLYAATFADKDAIADAIEAYNAQVDEEDQITYTDYVALLMSSITSIINAISYVLIAFVAISLVVSSIMIGIITYISVLERTKEIGILRAIGASKRDISRVFNAETLIVGFCSGAIGIGVTLLLTIPINMIIHHLTNIMNLNAALPPIGGIALVIISMVLTFIAGLIPSRIAAKKDPVVALRTE